MLAVLGRILQARTKLAGDVIDEVARALQTHLDLFDRPMAMIVEDRQWIDPSTRRVLEGILEGVTSGGILVLDTAREEGVGFDFIGGETILVEGLSHEPANRLIDIPRCCAGPRGATGWPCSGMPAGRAPPGGVSGCPVWGNR